MTTISEVFATKTEQRAARMLWLDLTRKCQLECKHCYNSSGPHGTHGTMSREDWISVLDQAAAYGVADVQFTGGEVTMHPDARDLVEHALGLRLKAEVYSNLAHVTDGWWGLFQREGVSLATSYYSSQAMAHNTMTARPSHARTRANIKKATQLGIPLRVGLIVGSETQDAAKARQDLEGLGVSRIREDHVRPFGRGAQGRAPDVSGLCGRCGTSRAAIGPNGDVSPCVFSGWLSVGNVHDTSLATILGSPAMARANTTIRGERSSDSYGCPPDGEDDECSPEIDEECRPGFPPSECTPRN